MIDLEMFDAEPGSVILIKGSTLDPESEEVFLSALMQRFEGCLIVILEQGMTFENMTVDELKQMLSDVIKHQEASTASGNPSE